MNAIHHVIDKIAANPRLANVPRPILEAVAELALTTLVDGLMQAMIDLGEAACCLEDLRVCEGCEAISGDVHDWGEVQLCAKCRDEEQACAASPTGKHAYDPADLARAEDDCTFDIRCQHCQPKPGEVPETESPAE